ncbi:unnamed protein product [Rhizopus stolonifer]
MTTPIPDPVAVSGVAIVTFMKEKEWTNLAYVKYFAKKSKVVNATFKALNSNGFTVSFKKSDGTLEETFIEYTTSVTRIEHVLPVLTAMANEAEDHLNLPRSMTCLPSLKELNDIQKSVFYAPDLHWQVLISLGLATNFLLGYASDDLLNQNMPLFLIGLRDTLSVLWIQRIFKGAILCHLVEGLFAFTVCYNRGYSPWIIFKWTLSTTMFGYASMSKLLNSQIQ